MEQETLVQSPTKDEVRTQHKNCKVTMEGRNFLVLDCPNTGTIGYETQPDADKPIVPPEIGSRAWIGRIDKVSEEELEKNPQAGIDLVLKQGLTNIGFLDRYFLPTDKVKIKVNLGSAIYDDQTRVEETVSHPDVLASVIDALTEIGLSPKNISIVEADSTWSNMDDKLLQKFGYDKLIRDKGIKFENLTNDERIPFEVPGENGSINITLAKSMLKDINAAQKTKIISVAPMKRHITEGVTLSIKNMFGAIPEQLKVHYHQTEGGLRHVIGAAARIMRPDLVINDGVIGCALDHAVCIPVNYKRLIVSNDMVCADHHASKLMFYPPDRAPHLKLSVLRGEGDPNCDLDGDKEDMINPLWEQYDVPPDLVAAVDSTLAGMAVIKQVPRWFIRDYARLLLQPTVAFLGNAAQGAAAIIYGLPELAKEEKLWQF